MHKFQSFAKSFANNFSTNIKTSKTQLHKIRQSGEFSGRILGPLLIIELPLIQNKLKLLGKRFLIQIGLKATASIADAVIHGKRFGSCMTTLIIAN